MNYAARIDGDVMIATESLTKRYGSLTALRDCDLQVGSCEIFGLLGPNGSGKTTLLRLLMGFLKPTRGTASIDGLDCYRDSVAVHSRVSYLPGDARLFRRMRGRDVLRFFSRIRPGDSLPRSLELAERLDLDISRRVSTYSTGMRQKLALVTVLAADTPLLILDEPTSSLDPTVRGTLINLVREARAGGRTVVFSSHVLSEVEEACDRVVILRQGKLVYTQVMSELRRCHRIRAHCSEPLPSPPDELRKELTLTTDSNGQVTIETSCELSRLLGWLATLPLAEIQIEPVGLAAVYRRYHAGETT